MMKKRIKVLRTAAAIFVLILVVAMLVLMRGLSEMQELVINDVDLTTIEDGVYIGTFDRYRWPNAVEVTVEKHRIVDIKTKKGEKKLSEELIKRIIAQQTLRVDVVSGATVSSNAFLKAVENALTN